MKDHLIQFINQTEPDEVGVRRNLVREYLHHYMLRLLAELRATQKLDFVGGTALRLLYQLPRFSEDLDFSLAESADRTVFDVRNLFTRLKDRLSAANYQVSVKGRAQKTVAEGFFGFSHLSAECGLTKDPRVKLSVKIEIDTNSPMGARSETTLIQRFLPFAVRHHDLPSLFAGKLHALISRPWVKGRDWYDLVWYLTVHPGLAPNEKLLANALVQTGHDPALARKWRRAIRERLATLDWQQVLQDMKPFVERQSDLDHLAVEDVLRVLERSTT
jgi:predicted nucleotidyltransferase component of viral defense system